MILPVYHPGALLFVGDGHALQADGESLGTGIETSMDLEFSVEVRKGAAASGPRVETADELISIGSHDRRLARAISGSDRRRIHGPADPQTLAAEAVRAAVKGVSIQFFDENGSVGVGLCASGPILDGDCRGRTVISNSEGITR